MNWTPEEDDLVREHFQDRPKLRAMLPHRTGSAINHRVQDLGLNLNKRFFNVTAKDLTSIRQLAKTCRTYQEIADALGLSRHAVRHHMYRRGIRFARTAPKMTGVVMVDAIRQRAFEMKLSLRDLDRSLGYRQKYFSKAMNAHEVTIGQIAKAVKALRGQLVVVWDDEQEEV